MSDLRSFFNQLYEDHNKALTPRMVVTATRAPDHEFHDRYWGLSDAEAAYEWRLDKAAEDIRYFRIKFREPTEDDDGTVREWVSLTKGEGQVYVKTEEVARDPVAAEVMLRDAERAWRALFARYEHLSEFVEMVKETLTASTRRRRAG